MHVLLLTLTILSTHDVRLRKQISFLRCQPVGHKLYVSDRMTRISALHMFLSSSTVTLTLRLKVVNN